MWEPRRLTTLWAFRFDTGMVLPFFIAIIIVLILVFILVEYARYNNVYDGVTKCDVIFFLNLYFLSANLLILVLLFQLSI
jgi:hypothetical protein